MSVIIAKVDVTKVLKEHLFPGKKGQKYLDLVFIENKDGEDDYGNTHFIVQGVTKQMREAGVKGPILGNANLSGQRKQKFASDDFGKRRSQPQEREEDSDVPF